MSATDKDAPADDYFQAIERTFIRLRGAPLLLSPADWQTARRWQEQGVPLAVVRDVLEGVFERVRSRDPKRKISSLSYCAPAVEEAWREIEDLSATAGRLEPDLIDVVGRLEELSAALPGDSPVGEVIGGKLAQIDGSAEAVEKSLERLDRQMLDLADRDVDDVERTEITRQARSALARALSSGGLEVSADLEGRLYREFLRRRLGLPTLSLFSNLSAGESD